MATKVIAQTADMPYDEWLELRRQGIGGSDASVVCGFNRYKSQMELWLEKTGQMPVQPAGEAAYWGSQLEDIVRAEFTRRTDIEVIRRPELLQSSDHPFMLANVDGICVQVPATNVAALSPLYPFFAAPRSMLTISPSWMIRFAFGIPWITSLFMEIHAVAGKSYSPRKFGVAPLFLIKS